MKQILALTFLIGLGLHVSSAEGQAVNGQEARLYLNDATQPALIVKDMKHGAAAAGAIGLWVEVGTEGYFADLKVTN